jgi:hypothetical protein
MPDLGESSESTLPVSGDIVVFHDEKRVVVDVTGEGDAVLRYIDDDPRRRVNPEGGDMHLEAAEAASLTVVGRIS